MRRLYRRGFSLVELLITIVIFLIIAGILFYLITVALRSFSNTASSTKKEAEVAVNTGPLMFDIKHAGYGISTNETSLVISYCNGTAGTDDACNLATAVSAERGKLLLLKETTNILRNPSAAPTTGFALWNGTAASGYPEDLSAHILNYDYCVWLGNEKVLLNETVCNKLTVANGTYPYLALGYPYDYNASCNNANPICCHNQDCTGIAYYLLPPNRSSVNAFKNCIEGTYILYRTTSDRDETNNIGTGSIYMVPVLACVSDWDVWFGLDTDGDGQPNTWINKIPYSPYVENNKDLSEQLTVMKIYFLVQASQSPDPGYNYCNYARCTDNNTAVVVDVLPDGTQVKLATPQDKDPYWTRYHWRVVELTLNTFPDIP